MWVIRNSKSEGRQYNGQQKENKTTNNVQQEITHRLSTKSTKNRDRVNTGTPGG